MRLADRLLLGISKLFFAVTAVALFLLAASLVAVPSGGPGHRCRARTACRRSCGSIGR